MSNVGMIEPTASLSTQAKTKIESELNAHKKRILSLKPKPVYAKCMDTIFTEGTGNRVVHKGDGWGQSRTCGACPCRRKNACVMHTACHEIQSALSVAHAFRSPMPEQIELNDPAFT
ncbi:hypothetical protein [Ethanoligenens harbinense]|uniref:hypothetical protein n=1 Tax=Ethanoligenens harbinense TaxID=253239 RepID=UPI0001C527D5|nr:hypothetical protein [Ethanoligenens harbinense]AVQ95580.1 hypothetical protein CXQ68_04620 [Ethanoligenens harbinense YUAN-3]AYF38244.1 hypothetical protein CXP51_04480 [Ethanoligenens harbinense]AYF40990.1 hypothetical protein CN246_04615 [Ethanoligenens harbinense]QCN91820.1 hypothetical protein DRA42_04630 [Ethanoligenens harbinense]